MIKIAAAGDLHFGKNSPQQNHPFDNLNHKADLLLLAGDLTQTGHPDEVKVLAEHLKLCPIPIIAVLGNHDYHSQQIPRIQDILQAANVILLEESSVTLQVGQHTIGVCGTKGFGGGFVGSSGSEFGEEEMKSFIRHAKDNARNFKIALSQLSTDFKVALLHYSPTKETLIGEKKEIYPFLGNYFLAQAIDEMKVDICFHGHAHHGVEKGKTPGGTPVRNVALPVIRHSFNIYTLEKNEETTF